jgi:transposase-like protein
LGETGNPEYVRAEVVPSVNGDAIAAFTEKAVEKASAIKTDGYSAYRKLSSKGYIHLPEKFDIEKSPDHLKWLHIVISNIKAFLNGTYHGVGRKHMQLFLDEFCYRFNRRFWQAQLFSRTLTACSSCPPFIWRDIVMS